MEEIWRDIDGFEGKYRVSTEGKVVSLNYLNTGKPRILKPKVNKQGYLEVTLNKHDKHHYRMVNRLVFETFMGVKLGKNDVLNPIDGDKTNSALSNLELITRGQRQEMTYDSGKRNRDVLGREYMVKYDFYGEMLTVKEMSRITGTKRDTICSRMTALGWSPAEAAEVPVGVYNNKGEQV